MLLVIILGAGTHSLAIHYYESFLKSDKIVMEEVVLEKQSRKGLFFPLYYQIITEESYPQWVSRSRFHSIEPGDVIESYGTRDNAYISTPQQVLEISLGLFLTLLLFALFLGSVLGLFLYIAEIPFISNGLAVLSMPWEKRKYEKRKHEKRNQQLKNKRKQSSRKDQKKNKKSNKQGGTILLIIVVPFFFLYATLYTVNMADKLNPFGKVMAEGRVIDKETNSWYQPRMFVETFDLTITFTAKDGEAYQVVKGVSENTFANHDIGSTIDIRYTKRNPYNIFINKLQFSDYHFMIFNIYTVLYYGSLLILLMLAQHYEIMKKGHKMLIKIKQWYSNYRRPKNSA